MAKATLVVGGLSVLFVVMGMGGSPRHQVEHAPTVEQCRADQSLWTAKILAGDSSDVTFETLGAWSHELAQCQFLDSDPGYVHAYTKSLLMIKDAAADRAYSFLQRHNLMKQFLEEDKAGKR